MKYLSILLMIVFLVGCSGNQEASSKREAFETGVLDIQFREGSSHCDFMYEHTVKELVDNVFCNTIIVAEIISSADPSALDISLSDEVHMRDVILTDVEVEEVLKGNLEEGDTIQVKERINYCVLEHFEAGDTVILFLMDWPGDPNKPYTAFSPYQGSLFFADDVESTRIDLKIEGTTETIFDYCDDLDDVIEAIEEALEVEG